VESKDLKPVSKEAEISFDGPTAHGRLSTLSHEEIALLRPCSDASLCIVDQVTSFSYRLESLDADGKEDPELLPGFSVKVSSLFEKV
jgi:hypothetical protein